MKKYKLWQIFLIIMFFPFSLIFVMLKNRRKKTTPMGTDLVEATFSFGCCNECAKYRGRVFSVTGADTRFPLKPAVLKCSCTGLDFYPFFYGVSEPVVNDCLNRKVDIIKFSNRPFVDDRTDEEKKIHEEYLEGIKNQVQKEIDRIEYEKLVAIIPDDVPKSFGAYRRMKNSQSSGFVKLREVAKKHDIQI